MKVGGQTNAPAAVLQWGDGPSTHRLIGQFCPTAGHDFLEKKKNGLLLPGFELWVVQSIS
jgi:hypothetical protein